MSDVVFYRGSAGTQLYQVGVYRLAEPNRAPGVGPHYLAFRLSSPGKDGVTLCGVQTDGRRLSLEVGIRPSIYRLIQIEEHEQSQNCLVTENRKVSAMSERNREPQKTAARV